MNNAGFVKVEVLQASNTKVLAINDTRVSLEKGYGIMTPIASFEVGVEDILNAMNYKPMIVNDAPIIEAEPISVDDRLPESIYDCLVWYSCDTPFGKSKSVGIAYCSRGDWYTKHLNGVNIVVLYWMPLPKPPKGEE